MGNGHPGRIGEAAQPGPKRDLWRLRTNNVTAWATGILEMEAATYEEPAVDVYLLQELHLVGRTQLRTASGRAGAAGWHGIISEARTTDAEGTSGGTGIFCRHSYGIGELEGNGQGASGGSVPGGPP